MRPRARRADTLAIVGPGRLGSSLAADLARAGPFSDVVLVGRQERPPNAIADLLASAGEALTYSVQPPEAPACIVFCVQDDDLVPTAAWWARTLASRAERESSGVALHVSGVHDHTALCDLAGLGWSTGSWHPLMALARAGQGQLSGVTFGIEGDPAAVEVAAELTQRVGGEVLHILPGRKASYHAAAVFASNYLVACLHAAQQELAAASDGAEFGALLSLARSAIDRVERHGLEGGATGPLTRGDTGTIRAHIAALDPARGRLYRALGIELLAAIDDRLEPDKVLELRMLLDELPPSEQAH
ncbi:MAG: DUF2520 domain-containing protein [Gemmatimonadota bacterium]